MSWYNPRSWVLWKPTKDWEWEFPEHKIERRGDSVHLHIDPDTQDDAGRHSRKWRADNPAPRWWLVWCAMFRRPVYPRTKGILGASSGAIPRVIDGPHVVHLHGRFEENDEASSLRGPLMTVRNGGSVVFHTSTNDAHD